MRLQNKRFNLRNTTFKEYLQTKVPNLFPSIIIISVIGAFLWTAFIIGIGSALRGLTVGIPAIVSAFLISKIYKKNVKLNTEITFFEMNEKRVKYIFWIVYIISFNIILITSSRTLGYFISIFLLQTIILLQIFSPQIKPSTILLELIVTMASLIYSATLKYPFYFGGVDVFGHIYLAQVTYLSGHVIPKDLDIYYAFFPLYHIIVSESANLLNLSVRESIHLIAVPIYVTTIPLIYYIFNRVIKNTQITLLTCLIYSSMAQVIYYGTYMVTRTMAFVAFIVILYLIYNSSGEKKQIYRILTMLFYVFLILVHQVSTPQILLLIGALLLCERMIDDKKYLNNNFFIFANVIFLSYWFYVAYLYVENVIKSRLQSQFFDSILLRSEIQLENSWIYVIEKMDSSILLFFVLIGIGYILWNNNKNKSYVTVYGLFSLSTLVLYIPNPLQTLWQTMILLRFDRFMLLLSPFISLVMAYGIWVLLSYVMSENSSINQRAFIQIFSFTLVLSFMFVSLFISTSDSKDLWTSSPRAYFDDKELDGFEYVTSYSPLGSYIYSDYHVMSYYNGIQFSGSETLGIPYYKSYTIKDIGSIDTYNGYKIIREEEFKENGLLFGKGSHEVKSYYENKESRKELAKNLNYLNKIYTNPAVDIYY